MLASMNPLDPWGTSLGGQNRLRVNLQPEDVPPFLQGQSYEYELHRWQSDTRQQAPPGVPNTIWDPRSTSLPQPDPRDELPLSLFGNDLTGPNFLFDPPLGTTRTQPLERNEPDDQDARHRAKVQEKNRKAQKRFRERQKTKFAGLTTKVEELEAKLSLLMQEKSKLEDRTLVLEKVLDLRQTPSDSETPSTPSDAGMHTPRTVPPRNKEDSFVDEASGEFGYVFNDELCMDIPTEGKVKLSPERIKRMTPQEVQHIYQKYVKAMKIALAQGAREQGPASPAGIELGNLVKDLSKLLVRVLALTPIVARQMHQQDNPPTPLSIQENVQLNRQILEKLNLNERQRSDLVQTVHRFRGRLDAIVKERQQIFARMQPELQDPSLGPTSEKAIDGFLLATQGTIALKENLRQEHWEVLNLLTTCFQVTNVVQTAVFMAESYPRWFDYIALATAAAHERAVSSRNPEGTDDVAQAPAAAQSAED